MKYIPTFLIYLFCLGCLQNEKASHHHSIKKVGFNQELIDTTVPEEISSASVLLDKNLIDRMYITHIKSTFDGDTYFPKLDFSKWTSSKIMTHKKDEQNPHDFEVVEYNKRN